MLKNYLKVAYRNLLSNKLYAFINIFGMGTAIAFCIVAYLNHTYNYIFDSFHKNAEQVFRVKTVLTGLDGQEYYWGWVPRPLGPALVKDFPAVERAVRLTESSATFRFGDKVFNETVLHTDANFFEMFDFSLKYGRPDVLQDKSKIVLSEEFAHKYFGEESPIGKRVTVRYDDGQTRDFFIGAVAEDIPDYSSIQFDVLAALEVLLDMGRDRTHDWTDWTHVAFVRVSDPTQLSTIVNQLDDYIAAHNDAASNSQIARFYFDPLRNLALNAWTEDLEGDILKRAMHPAGMISPTIIAVLLLLMACFNYINTSIAFSSKRLKEIGMRKVIGGARRQLIAQFLGENFLICLLALVLGMGLAEILVPAYDNLWVYFDLTLDYTENFGLLVFLAGLLLLVGIGAGAYPAMYISAYRPAVILQGAQKFGRTSWFTRTLLGFQFSVSVLTVIASLFFIQNSDFLKNMDLGYNKEQVVVVPLARVKEYEPYRNAIEGNPNLLNVAGSRDHVQYRWYVRQVENAGVESRADIFGVGYDYLKTMKLRLLAGRDFDENLLTDMKESVIVSQKLVRDFGWNEPLGQTLTIDSTRYTVIGMVDDFYNRGAWSPISASVFRLVEPEAFRYLTARIRPQNLSTTADFLHDTWRNIAPDVPYQGFFQDKVMAEAISVSESIKTMFLYIALLAIVIAAMGLFALVSLNIARRTKEIGIRKVLGATVIQIINLVNKEFVGLLVAASVVACVFGYFGVQALLSSIYTYHVGFTIIPFLLASLAIFTIALLTVGSQVVKLATTNPADALRYE